MMTVSNDKHDKKTFFGRFAMLSLGVMIAMSVINPCDAKPVSLKVALCQIFCLDGDRNGNLTRIENGIVDAKSQGARLVCFPETAIYGWVNPDAHQRAFPIPGKDSDRLCELAKKYGVYLCVGLAEKTESSLYDSVVLIDDSGNLLMTHRKINNLTNLMTPPYTPGRDVNVVDTPLGRIGMLICADTFVKDNLQQMADLKADIVLVPYGWAAKEEAWPEHGKQLHKTVSNAAKAIGAPVIGTDLVGSITHGPWTGQVYGGQSVVADASGTIIATAKDRDRHILVVDIPLSIRIESSPKKLETK